MALSITPRHTFPKLPLALYESHVIAGAESSTGDPFTIVVGLDKSLAEKLKTLSGNTDDAELAKTSDRERFVTGSYEEWYQGKDRTLFALIHQESGRLAALAWFGPKPFGRKSLKHLSDEERGENERAMKNEGWHTVVYRSYAPFRGTGLMKDFVRFAMKQYATAYPEAKFWAGIFSDGNPASLGLAKALGFVEKNVSDQGETILVKV